ncbi:cytochrome P450 [Gymnopus androsaceus JB14]|uniref:Cytochrome P450 n=1 Tax=Gymnopus androsaceus JB14 TaxID=1447944 RepID=A0A6A4GZX8_9AGAR|nr:cytochrome P450 [Gymnopus androsaceus JB14]
MEERKEKRVRTKILSFVPNVHWQILQLQCRHKQSEIRSTPCSVWSFVGSAIEYGNDPICLPGQVDLSTDNFRAYVGMIEDEVEEFISSDASFSAYQSNDITAWGSFDLAYTSRERGYKHEFRTDLNAFGWWIHVHVPESTERQGTEEDERLLRRVYSEDESWRIGTARPRHDRRPLGPEIPFHEALYQEQVKHFGVNGEPGKFRPIAYEDLRDLPALDSVIRETLRVHPPIHSIMRTIVPKGHVVLASPLFAQMDPAILKNPNKWEPSRYNEPEGVAIMALKEYTDEAGEKIDFGFGAFAYLQLGTILSTLIRKMEFKLPSGVPEHNYHTIITMPKTPREHYRQRQFD